MSLNESIVEDAALEWFLLRRGYGGQVGDQPTPRLRLTGLGYPVGHGAAFAKLRRAKPPLAPGEPAAKRDSFGEVVQSRCAQTLTRPLPSAISAALRFPWGEEMREAMRRLNPAIRSRTLSTLRHRLLPKLLSGEFELAQTWAT